MVPTYNIMRERIMLRILLRRVWLTSKVYGRLGLDTRASHWSKLLLGQALMTAPLSGGQCQDRLQPRKVPHTHGGQNGMLQPQIHSGVQGPLLLGPPDAAFCVGLNLCCPQGSVLPLGAMHLAFLHGVPCHPPPQPTTRSNGPVL